MKKCLKRLQEFRLITNTICTVGRIAQTKLDKRVCPFALQQLSITNFLPQFTFNEFHDAIDLLFYGELMNCQELQRKAENKNPTSLLMNNFSIQ